MNKDYIIFLMSLVILGLVSFLALINAPPHITGFAVQYSEETTLKISQADKDRLVQMFRTSEADGLEKALCFDLKGDKLYNAREVTYFEQESDRLVYSCSGDVTIHTHPSGGCWLSSQDYYTFGRTNDEYAGIICGETKIIAYHKSDVDSKVQVIVE